MIYVKQAAETVIGILLCSFAGRGVGVIFKAFCNPREIDREGRNVDPIPI